MSTSYSPSSWDCHFEQKILSKKGLELANINCTLTGCAFGRGVAWNSSETSYVTQAASKSETPEVEVRPEELTPTSLCQRPVGVPLAVSLTSFLWFRTGSCGVIPLPGQLGFVDFLIERQLAQAPCWWCRGLGPLPYSMDTFNG